MIDFKTISYKNVCSQVILCMAQQGRSVDLTPSMPHSSKAQ